MSEYLQKIVYLTQSQYETLAGGGSITANGTTLTGINENWIYITDGNMSVSDLGETIIDVAHGGTGNSSLYSGQLLVGNGTSPITSMALASSITNVSTTVPTTAAVYNDALLKSGGTMTGILTAKANQYADSYSGSLNMNNSNIYGLNSIYTADVSDNASEGIHFYRDSSHVDTLWMNGGNIYFVPNRAFSTSTTAANSEKVLRLPASINGSRVLYSDGTNGKIAESSVTSTELSYLSGVTSAIDTTYLKKSGGQMTGPLTWKDSNALPEATSLSYILGIDAFANGGTTKWIGIANLISSLGLSNALHFIGITSTSLTDGSTTSTLTAKTTNSLTKTTGFIDGDVVMDGDQLREYVWSGSAWRLLGITTSTAYSQTATGNSWITSITQGTDGKITATKGSLSTTEDNSNTLYVIGVANASTSVLNHNTNVTITGGAVNATTYNKLTLTAAATGFTIAGGTTSKTLTVSDNITLKTGSANYIAYYSATGTIQGHGATRFSDTWSSTTKNGKNELVLGNSTVSTNNGSAYGQLALYSESSAGTYLKSASGTSWKTATLPAITGILAILNGGTAKGTNTKPVKVANTGEIQECSEYAGGTKVTLNNVDKGASTATIYAPTEGGTAGYSLIGAGTTSTPVWYAGATFSGTAAADYAATFAGTTDSSSVSTGAVKISGGLGVAKQITAARLAANGNNTSYNLYVNGTSLLNGNTTVNGNLVPGANNTKTLGSTDAKWSKLYVGSSEFYGNAYQPVYWNNGVPAVSYPVQYSTWSIDENDNAATLTGTGIFTDHTYVISLVVTSGEENLNGPITWETATDTLVLKTAATSGVVSGYVLTAIGTATGITSTSSTITTNQEG